MDLTPHIIRILYSDDHLLASEKHLVDILEHINEEHLEDCSFDHSTKPDQWSEQLMAESSNSGI